MLGVHFMHFTVTQKIMDAPYIEKQY